MISTDERFYRITHTKLAIAAFSVWQNYWFKAESNWLLWLCEMGSEAPLINETLFLPTDLIALMGTRNEL
jgi:hypothetical protein